MLLGWTSVGDADRRHLLQAVRELKEPEPVRTSSQRLLRLIIAAAAARAGDGALADSIVAGMPVEKDGLDERGFRAAYLRARGRDVESAALLGAVHAPVRHERLLRNYHRLLTND